MVQAGYTGQRKKWTALAAFPGGPRDQATSALLMAICMCLAALAKTARA